MKIEAVVSWESLKIEVAIKSFLGLVGYYRIFVKELSTIANLLIKLTRKDVPFVWREHCEASFQELKTRLTITPILKLPTGNGGFVNFTDASGVGLGCVLMQE